MGNINYLIIEDRESVIQQLSTIIADEIPKHGNGNELSFKGEDLKLNGYSVWYEIKYDYHMEGHHEDGTGAWITDRVHVSINKLDVGIEIEGHDYSINDTAYWNLVDMIYDKISEQSKY